MKIIKDNPLSIRYDDYGDPVALEIEGWTVLNLTPTERTIVCVKALVEKYNELLRTPL